MEERRARETVSTGRKGKTANKIESECGEGDRR